MGLPSFRIGWLAAVAALVACARPPAQIAPRKPAADSADLYEGPLANVKATLQFVNQDYRKELGGRALFVLHKPTVRYFVAPTACGQGPFELSVPNDVSGWQQFVSMYALSPRTLSGWYDHGRIRRNRSEPLSRSKEPPDNRRCVLTLSQEAAAKRAAVGARAAPPMGAPEQGPALEGTSAATVVRPAIALREIPPPASLPHGKYYKFLSAGSSTRDPSGRPINVGDPETVIRVWFDTPNDLEGVVFVIEQATARLGVPEAEYRALAEARLAKRDQYDRDEAAARQQGEARDEYCEAHHDDQSCWPRGYARVQAEAAQARRENEAYVRRAEAETKHREADAKLHPPPPPAEPDRPPPLPQPEAPPPRPSANAAWTAGYWSWVEGRWLWLAGRWSVPASDVERDLTVHAPTPPPAPRAEAAPPPVISPTPSVQPAPVRFSLPPAVVWTPGFWQWDGARWVWVAGAWQRPPTPSATWRPDRWQPRGAGAVFLPGGWKLELGTVPR
jgi:hypothetical protein